MTGTSTSTRLATKRRFEYLAAKLKPFASKKAALLDERQQ